MSALLAVPLATGSMLSMPRFLLVMFPMYLVLAILGRRAAVHDTLLVVGMCLGWPVHGALRAVVLGGLTATSATRAVAGGPGTSSRV